MRVTLLALTLLICHQALALPVTSVEGSESQADPIFSIEISNEIATSQVLDSRSPSHDNVTTDLDTRSLQRRGIPWESSPLNGKVSILLNAAAATTLQVANGWLSWQFNMYYNKDTESWTGTVYSDGPQSASDLSVCVNQYTQATYGNTAGLMWSEGQVDLEAAWRSVPLLKTVKIFWSATVRFYQKTNIGRPIASTVLNTIGNTVGYQLQYDDNWVCTTRVGDNPALDIEQTKFESCHGGES
jgi:hypothetical protein